MFNCLKIESLFVDNNGNYTAYVVNGDEYQVVFIAKEVMGTMFSEKVLWVSVKQNYDYLNEEKDIWNSIATSVFAEITLGAFDKVPINAEDFVAI